MWRTKVITNIAIFVIFAMLASRAMLALLRKDGVVGGGGRGIAVFTSGGDSQGMNAAVRAVVRLDLMSMKEIRCGLICNALGYKTLLHVVFSF